MKRAGRYSSRVPIRATLSHPVVSRLASACISNGPERFSATTEISMASNVAASLSLLTVCQGWALRRASSLPCCRVLSIAGCDGPFHRTRAQKEEARPESSSRAGFKVWNGPSLMHRNNAHCRYVVKPYTARPEGVFPYRVKSPSSGPALFCCASLMVANGRWL